jgi:large subunit ribosomal protein L22
MKAVAKLKNCPLSARKMRMVVDLIRGKSVEEAINILKYNKREASEWTTKVVLSAVSNWENKGDMAYSADDYKLYISEIFSDEGTFLKRFRPAPHGRAHRIRKRTNHLTVVVENRVPIKELDNSNS